MELFFVAVQIVVPPVFVIFRVVRVTAVHVKRVGDIGKIGIEKGRAEGLAESRKETAIAMLKEGMPVDFTAKISKLSVEEVEKIKADL